MTSLTVAPTHGPRLWYAIAGGIVLWMIHISVLAALVNVACGELLAEWAMHGLTVVLGIATVVAMWWCHLLAVSAGDGSESPLSFLGRFGLYTGAFSLLLIVWEGVYIPFISPCA